MIGRLASAVYWMAAAIAVPVIAGCAYGALNGGDGTILGCVAIAAVGLWLVGGIIRYVLTGTKIVRFRPPSKVQLQRSVAVMVLVGVISFARGYYNDQHWAAQDAQQFKTEMSGATASNYRDKLANATSKTAQFIKAVLSLSDRYNAQFSAVYRGFEIASLDGQLTVDAMANQEKRAPLKAAIEQKLQAAEGAPARVDAILRDYRTEFIAAIPPQYNQKSVLASFDQSIATRRELIFDYSAANTSMYNHLLAMLALLDGGKFAARKDNIVAVTNNAPVDAYNREAAAFRKAAADADALAKRINDGAATSMQQLVDLPNK